MHAPRINRFIDFERWLSEHRYNFGGVDGVVVVEDKLFFYTVGFLGRARELAKKNGLGSNSVWEIPQTPEAYDAARRRINRVCPALWYAVYRGRLVSLDGTRDQTPCEIKSFEYAVKNNVTDVKAQLLTRDQIDRMEVVS